MVGQEQEEEGRGGKKVGKEEGKTNSKNRVRVFLFLLSML